MPHLPHRIRRRAPLIAALAVLVSSLGPAQQTEHTDPWSILEELRQNLGRVPRTADFVQIYQPAGFTTGDRETGSIYLGLPACARWDYEDPYPKIFLLCESTIHTWNPGDRAGRRYRMVDSEEPGIDLLRLRLEELEPRYEARVEDLPDGSIEVILSPRQQESAISEARLTIGEDARLLRTLSYRDREGNVSRFEISNYQPFEIADHFAPPEELEWLDK